MVVMPSKAIYVYVSNSTSPVRTLKRAHCSWTYHVMLYSCNPLKVFDIHGIVDEQRL